MTKPKPAVDRASAAIKEAVCTGWPAYISDRMAGRLAAVGLTAALTDPDDPDTLARTLFVLHLGAYGTPATDALSHWHTAAGTTREHWRAVADGLRMVLTGSGS